MARSTFESRPNDIFIASYPHSGGDWMQRLVQVLALNGDVPYLRLRADGPRSERPTARR